MAQSSPATENWKGNASAAVSLPRSDGHEKVDGAEVEKGSSDGKEKEREKHAPPPQASDGSKKKITEEIVEEEGSSSASGAMDKESFPTNEDTEFETGMKEHEKKALAELRSMVEHAILKNKIFKDPQKEEESHNTETQESKKVVEDHNEGNTEDKVTKQTEAKTSESDEEISIWGVPLLPSKGDKGTDGVLLKFLRAREFKANDAFEMLRNTLEWRRNNNIDTIMEEDLGNEYNSVSYMKGLSRDGHRVCYNVYSLFADDEVYNRTFGTEAGQARFLRWRLQLLEKEIRKLDFGPGGVSTLIQVNDLKNTPGPSRKDLRQATRRVVEILQDNYPEFVASNIFINVPFWYYALNALLSAFLTQRTTSKLMFSRPATITDTLLKCIAAEEIPAMYGGLQRDNDSNFSTEDKATEVVLKAGATETIEIPMPEVGMTMIWDLSVTGWDVTYKEEFVPTDEESYVLIVKREKKISWTEESIRNSFKNKEAGKVVITIENGIFKKKRVIYRYKIKNVVPASS